MASFYDVTTGATGLAADVNQYADRLNGTTSAQVKILTLNNATSALQGLLASAPAADQTVFDSLVSGDAFVRVATYIRSADGYGGVRAGTGAAGATAHLYAQANGWKIDETLTIGGALNVTGTSTFAGVNAGAVVGSSLQSTGGLTVAGGSSLDNGAITTNGAGAMTLASVALNQPPLLRAGNQETGYWSLEGQATGAQSWGASINFKTVLAHTPTSITFTQLIIPVNVGTLSVFTSSIYGTHARLTTNGAGNFYWEGTYVTVGNCLLAVNEAARTFDHHCDNPRCGHVSRDVPLTALHVTPWDARGSALSYHCPRCGAVECFMTTLGAEDEADTTPQGSGEFATTRGTQATRIRALLRLCDLPVVA